MREQGELENGGHETWGKGRGGVGRDGKREGGEKGEEGIEGGRMKRVRGSNE